LLLIQIADAVEAFHSHGFVHLDLKPANVLMGTDGRPRLLDFGIAEPIGHPPEVPRGTPGYASPEVTAGRPASRASDVYGLAAIGYAKARPQLSFKVAAAALIVSGLLLQQLHPGADTGAANAGTLPALVRPAFDVPPLGAYGAAFESQAPYPSASPNSTVEWT